MRPIWYPITGTKRNRQGRDFRVGQYLIMAGRWYSLTLIAFGAEKLNMLPVLPLLLPAGGGTPWFIMATARTG